MLLRRDNVFTFTVVSTSAVVNKISLAQFYTLFVYFQPLRNNQFDSMSATQGNPCSTFNGKIQLYLIYGILPSKGLTVTYFNYFFIECPFLFFSVHSGFDQDCFCDCWNNVYLILLESIWISTPNVTIHKHWFCIHMKKKIKLPLF